MLSDYLFYVLSKEWNRPVKEIDVRNVYKQDYGYLLLINVLGIPKERLLVDATADNLVITGDVELDEIDFKNSVSYELSLEGIDVKKIDYTVKDGLLFVEIHEDKPKQKQIKVTRK